MRKKQVERVKVKASELNAVVEEKGMQGQLSLF